MNLVGILHAIFARFSSIVTSGHPGLNGKISKLDLSMGDGRATLIFLPSYTSPGRTQCLMRQGMKTVSQCRTPRSLPWISILLVGNLSNTPYLLGSETRKRFLLAGLHMGSPSNIQDETIVASG